MKYTYKKDGETFVDSFRITIAVERALMRIVNLGESLNKVYIEQSKGALSREPWQDQNLEAAKTCAGLLPNYVRELSTLLGLLSPGEGRAAKISTPRGSRNHSLNLGNAKA